MRGFPLMPCSPAKARYLLRAKKAVVKRRTPFTIQLMFATGEAKQDIALGVDAGAKHIGLSASTKKEELFASEVELRQDIKALIAERRCRRCARRHRKTRYRAPRFDNRVRITKKGRLHPSIENRIEAHISRIKEVCALMPITEIVIETASFDIRKIQNPNIEGKGYRSGDQLGFRNVREYVLFRDNYTCRHCHGRSKNRILHVHHIESRRTGGDAPNNLITLCEACHKALHAGEIQLNIARVRSFKSEAAMSIMRPTLLKRVRVFFPEIPVEETFGHVTKYMRELIQLPKSHVIDAFCIAGNLNAKRRGVYLFQKQTRKHNRQINNVKARSKKLPDGSKVSYRKLHQMPYVVNGFRLFDKVMCNGVVCLIRARRKSGYFDVRTPDGVQISPGISYKKLKLLEKKKTFIGWLKRENSSENFLDKRNLESNS